MMKEMGVIVKESSTQLCHVHFIEGGKLIHQRVAGMDRIYG